MRRPRPTTAVLALILAGTTACMASYHPRRGPRIVELDGDFHRDGQKFEIGWLGGGAQELVAGNPRALEYARRKQSLARRGFAAYGLGLLTMLASPVAAIAPPEQARAPVFVGVLSLGAFLAVLGSYWDTQGRAALFDAVNVYNDDLEAARLARPPAAALGGPP